MRRKRRDHVGRTRGSRSARLEVRGRGRGLLTREEVEALVSEFSLDLISVHASDGEYLYASANAEELFGWRPEQLVGRGAREYFHPDDLVRIEREEGSRPFGGTGRIQYRLRCGDGAWRWVETRCRAELRDGNVNRIVCLTRDIERERRRGTVAAAEPGASDTAASFLVRTRSAIAHLGYTRSVTAKAVARELGVSLRTLQRRLQEQSRTVSLLRVEVFRAVAERMLRDAAPTQEVARRVGFSSRSSFQRAFRRWTGATPGSFRTRSRS